jgi:hypothetical protein
MVSGGIYERSDDPELSPVSQPKQSGHVLNANGRVTELAGTSRWKDRLFGTRDKPKVALAQKIVAYVVGAWVANTILASRSNLHQQAGHLIASNRIVRILKA